VTAPAGAPGLAGRRILVTGATGLLGGEVAELLSTHDAPVGWLARAPRPREPHVPVPADLTDPPAVERAVRAFAPDVVIHLAAAVGDRLDALVAKRANVDATLALQRVTAERGARLIVASTVLVLGLDDLVDAPEETPRTRAPMIPYVATKVEMEERLEGTDAVVLRFPRIYGERDGMILPEMLKLMRAGQMVLIDGGESLQSFVHVSDAARACLLAAEKGAAGRTYHVTGGDRVTNRRILELVADAAGLPRVTRKVPRWLALGIAGVCEALRLPIRSRFSRFRVKYVGCHHHYSIERARSELGYEPRVKIEEGLPAVVRAMLADSVSR
jgi:nucleoside-diphosphate-sugar epimerase